jgi:hypothetical protein
MSHVLYAYIAKQPTTTQVGSFLRALADRGVLMSHLVKDDRPRKFAGSIDEAHYLPMNSPWRSEKSWTICRIRPSLSPGTAAKRWSGSHATLVGRAARYQAAAI